MTILPEVLASLAFKIGERVLTAAIERGLPTPRFIHNRQLSITLRAMPFIYKDLQLDVLTDFVEVDVSGVDPETLRPRKQQLRGNAYVLDKLREHRTIALLGDAGIGKTTLCRFSIQTILGTTDKLPPIHRSEDVIPFYVPLKAVDNAEPFPIYRYLLSTYRYLHGNRGRKRLISLAAKRRVMLFLDGYDEISYVGGSDFIKSELSLLLGHERQTDRHLSIIDPMPRLYNDLRQCRIWFTSRPEFLRSNPLSFGQSVTQLAAAGVHTHRQRLAQKIFEHHKKRGDFRAETLQSEDFMYALNDTGDEALRALSDNPLFLTILCYVYAAEVRNERDPNQALKRGVYALVSECISLLVEDLDKQKSGELAEPNRVAMTRRRAAWPTQKLAFLRYLAAESYLASRGTLDEDWVFQKAREFFNLPNSDMEREVIVAGLETTDPARNLVRQLVLSDVFSVIARPAQCPIYDFPHRRFREVLATDFWNTTDGVRVICANLASPAFAELIIVYVQRSEFRSEVMDAALTSIATSADTYQVARVFEGCLISRAGRPDEREKEVLRLLSALERNALSRAPASLCAYFSPSSISQWDALKEAFALAIQSRNRRLFALCSLPLEMAFPERLDDLLVTYWNVPCEHDDLTYDVLTLTSRLTLRAIGAAVLSFWPNPNYSDVLGRSFARFITVAYRQTTSRVREEVLARLEIHFARVDPHVRAYVMRTESSDKSERRKRPSEKSQDSQAPREIEDLVADESDSSTPITKQRSIKVVDDDERPPIATIVGLVAPLVWVDDIVRAASEGLHPASDVAI